jgi:hypothetical protein
MPPTTWANSNTRQALKKLHTSNAIFIAEKQVLIA